MTQAKQGWAWGQGARGQWEGSGSSPRARGRDCTPGKESGLHPAVAVRERVVVAVSAGGLGRRGRGLGREVGGQSTPLSGQGSWGGYAGGGNPGAAAQWRG